MTRRKTLAAILAAVMAICSFLPAALAAPEPFDAGDYKVRAFVLTDASTGKVIAEQDASEQNFPASTTKIISCLVALDHGSLDDEITVGPEVNVGSGESAMGLRDGETVTLRDLLYGMMLPSGNDAAKATAVAIGGSIEGFAQMMNDKAAELGMDSSHFVNPHGTADPDHYTTAADMALAARVAMQNDFFRQLVSTTEYTASGHELDNTNKLILPTDSKGNTNDFYYEYATGIKTGSTPVHREGGAGKCLVASAEKDGSSLICVVYGDETDAGNQRWSLARELFEYGFANYKTIDLSFLLAQAQPVSVKVEAAAVNDEGAGYLELTPVIGSDGMLAATVTAEEADAIAGGAFETRQELSELTAPVEEGSVCGKIQYLINGVTFYEVNLVASRAVADISAEADASESPVKTQETVSVESIPGKEISPWWWLLLVPFGLIVFLIIRIITVKNRRKKRARSRSRQNYSRYRY